MTLRLPARYLGRKCGRPLSTTSTVLSPSPATAAAAAGHTQPVSPPGSNQSSNLPPELRDAISREASLPTADPPIDSQTTRLTDEHLQRMVPTYVRPPPMFAKGQGCKLYDLDNREYLDFTAGIAVNALGHCDEGMANVISAQATTLVHTSNLYHNPWTGLLSSCLVETTLASGAMRSASRAFICNSGSEANEAAIKFARKHARKHYPNHKDKYGIVSFQGAFHGRTLGALSATPNTKYQAPFGPLIPGFVTGQFNCAASCLDSLITPERTAGVIVEPIQGEGGVNVATPHFLRELRKKCDEAGALLIYDEIQCGLGRTGSFWAHGGDRSRDAPHPDILTTAKALGNGFPVGATVVSEVVSNSMVSGDHGTTFGGNPLGARIAHYLIDRLSDPTLLRSVAAKEQLLRARLHALRGRFPDIIKEVRGRGLILGVQLEADPTPLVTAARERGLLIITCGTNTLRLVPPLIVSEDEIEQAMRVLGQAMESVFGRGDKVKGTRGQQEMAPAGSHTT